MYKPYYLKDVYESSSKSKFTVISTFAGGGGSSTGYKLAGGQILLVNEFVESARETYLANYPDTPMLSQDIKDLAANEATGSTEVKTTELANEQLDKLKIEKDIEKDFEKALIGIKKLSHSSRGGVYLAYIYYYNLFQKIP